MLELRFSDLKELTGVRFEHCEALIESDPVLGNINTDSRSIRSGEIFWVLRGERFDAHVFVKDAFAKGAVFAVVEKAEESVAEKPLVVVPDSLRALQELAALKRRRFTKPVIGLTGSNGKTTTKEMIAHLLSARWKVHKNEGNLNNHIGLPLTLLRLKPWHQVAVVEMGSNHPGEIARLAEIAQPDWALITNIGPAHLGNFNSLEAIAKEKLSLFESLPEGKMIFVNANDEILKDYKRAGLKRVTFGFDVKADISGKILNLDKNGYCTFRLNDAVDIKLNVPGLHNAFNALAAASVALFSGIDPQQIKESLESYRAYDQRMQMIEKNGIRILNDAYNANPESMKAAFATLQRMSVAGNLYLALGDMLELGEQSFKMHRQILTDALNLKPKSIFLFGEQMKEAAGDLNDPRLQVFDDHRSLAAALKSQLKSGDLLFIKGSRGAQMEKILEYL